MIDVWIYPHITLLHSRATARTTCGYCKL